MTSPVAEFTRATLPKLQDRPSFEELFAALESLAIQPASWSTEATEGLEFADDKNVNDYLLSIISSDLEWLEASPDDEASGADPKEVLWDLASKRIAERCGRTAMPEMTRTWVIPASHTHPELKFEIREPPLTGDNLGFKTWGTAFAISKKLEELGSRFFHHLIHGVEDNVACEAGSNPMMSRMRVLELGSGTGLVGIAAAAIWRVSVVLTDLPEIQGNLLYNVHQNAYTIDKMGGDVVCTVLDWKHPEGAFAEDGNKAFEAVIAADPLYDDEHPELIANMMKKYLKYDQGSRALIAIPLRDKGTKALVRKLIDFMRLHGFQLSNQGEEIFKDDWVNANEDGVKCWWSIWCWNIPRTP